MPLLTTLSKLELRSEQTSHLKSKIDLTTSRKAEKLERKLRMKDKRLKTYRLLKLMSSRPQAQTTNIFMNCKRRLSPSDHHKIRINFHFIHKNSQNWSKIYKIHVKIQISYPFIIFLNSIHRCRQWIFVAPKGTT